METRDARVDTCALADQAHMWSCDSYLSVGHTPAHMYCKCGAVTLTSMLDTPLHMHTCSALAARANYP